MEIRTVWTHRLHRPAFVLKAKILCLSALTMALATCNIQHSDPAVTKTKSTSAGNPKPAVEIVGVWSVVSVTDQGHSLGMNPKLDLRLWFQRAGYDTAITVLYGTEGCPIVGGFLSRTGSRFSFKERANNAAVACVVPPPEFESRLRSELLAGFNIQQVQTELQVKAGPFHLTMRKRTAPNH